jgi:hypothetical protein
MFLSLIFFHTAAVVPILSNELMGAPKTRKYRTKDELRRLPNLVFEYRKIELLHKQSMMIYGILIIPAQSLLAQFILYSNFTLIRHWSDLGRTMQVMILVLSFAMFTSWCLILEISGRFHVNSIRLLKSWKMLEFRSKYEAKYLSKFRKGCRPLSIGLPGYIKIKRLTVLKFMKGIVGGTFRALLTL